MFDRGVTPLVSQCQPYVFVQECKLPEACIQLLEIIDCRFCEYGRIGLEPNKSSGFLCGPGLSEWRHGMASILKPDEILFSTLKNCHFHPLGKSIHH